MQSFYFLLTVTKDGNNNGNLNCFEFFIAFCVILTALFIWIATRRPYHSIAGLFTSSWQRDVFYAVCISVANVHVALDSLTWNLGKCTESFKLCLIFISLLFSLQHSFQLVLLESCETLYISLLFQLFNGVITMHTIRYTKTKWQVQSARETGRNEREQCRLCSKMKWKIVIFFWHNSFFAMIMRPWINDKRNEDSHEYTLSSQT